MNEKMRFDVAIIGGGPGGIAAAIWSADLGLSTVLIEENNDLGGQLLRVHNPITNYPGRIASDGRDLRDHFLETLNRFASLTILHERVETVDLKEKHIALAGGEVIECSAVVLATGVRRRRLNVRGEAEYVGRGILESGAGEKERCRGKAVVIIGGGDAALENAVILSEYASRIYVVHRRTAFSARKEFVHRALNDPKVEFRLESVVRKLSGGSSLEQVVIEHVRDGRVETLDADAALIRIGVEPNSELFADRAGLDPAGYVIVDQFCRTTVDGVFAVGDVANPVSPTIISAAGMGATAAKSAYDLICRKQRL